MRGKVCLFNAVRSIIHHCPSLNWIPYLLLFMAMFDCNICGQFIALELKIFHLAKCIHGFCNENEMPCPMCTLTALPTPSTAPSTAPSTTSSISHPVRSVTPASPAPATHQSPVTPTSPHCNINNNHQCADNCNSNKPRQSESLCACNPEQLLGFTCFVCDKKKEKKIPGTLAIGKYRQIRFCKKGELTDPVTRKAIETAIDQQVLLVKENDAPPLVNDDSDSDTDGESDNDELCYCDGYRDTHGSECNVDPFKPILTFTTLDNTRLAFCKASHLTRYLVRHYTALSKGKQSTSSRKRKIPEDDETQSTQSIPSSSSFRSQRNRRPPPQRE